MSLQRDVEGLFSTVSCMVEFSFCVVIVRLRWERVFYRNLQLIASIICQLVEFSGSSSMHCPLPFWQLRTLRPPVTERL
jgi:hypothetical protein